MSKDKGLIYIMDMESTLSDALVRRIIDMDQYLVYRKWNMEIDPEQEVATYGNALRGIIFSGSSKNVNSKKYDPPSIPTPFLQTGVPILGICYGMQYIAHIQNRKIIRCFEEADPKKRNPKKDQGEQGPVDLHLTGAGLNSVLFKGLGQKFPVWMKHRYMIEEVPEGWSHTAATDRCPFAAMEQGNVFAVQFHPEPYNSLFGRIILHNFLSYACEVKTPYF